MGNHFSKYFEGSDFAVSFACFDGERYQVHENFFFFFLVWCLDLQAYVNNIDFDYMEYARQRFQQYWLKKPKILDISVDSLCETNDSAAELKI